MKKQRKFNAKAFKRRWGKVFEHKTSQKLNNPDVKHHEARFTASLGFNWECGREDISREDAIEILSLYLKGVNKELTKEINRLKRLKD